MNNNNAENKLQKKGSLTFNEVGDYLNSDRFVGLLANYDISTNDLKGIMEILTSVALDYADIFSRSETSSIEELEEILKGVLKREIKKEEYDINQVFKNKIIRDCGFNHKEDLSEEQNEIVKDKMIELLEFKRTKFHAFNGAFLDSIKEHGVDPNQKMLEEEQSVLYYLLEQNGAPNGRISADEGFVSYSGTPKVSYGYALTSPEWFSRVCGPDDYVKRDYDACKKHLLEKVAKRYNFSKEDENVLMYCFERIWNIVCDSKLYVSITPNDYNYNEEQKNGLRNRLKQCYGDNLFKILSELREYNTNGRSSDAIKSEDTAIVELPRLTELQKRIDQIKEVRKGDEISLTQ